MARAHESVGNPRAESMLRTLSKIQGVCQAPGMKKIVGSGFAIGVFVDAMVSIMMDTIKLKQGRKGNGFFVLPGCQSR